MDTLDLNLLKREKSNIDAIGSGDGFTTVWYKPNSLPENIAQWVDMARNAEGVNAGSISYIDFWGNSIVGNDSIEFSGQTDTNILRKELKDRNIDFIVINGEYENRPLKICFRMYRNEIGVTSYDNDPVNIGKLEKALHLL